MISIESLTQLKAFARQEGAILAVVWLVSMWLMINTTSSWGPLMMLSTPFFIGWRLNSFRDGALDGRISFRRALAFSCYVFFYASLLFAIGQYVYFRWMDGGAFLRMLQEGVATMKPVYQSQGISSKELDMAVEMIRLMKPADIIFVFMMQNIIIGSIVSPLISVCCKKS